MYTNRNTKPVYATVGSADPQCRAGMQSVSVTDAAATLADWISL